MGRRSFPDDAGGYPDLPDLIAVEIRTVSEPGAVPPRVRRRGLRRTPVWGALAALAAVTAVVATALALTGSTAHQRPATNAAARAAGPAGVAAAYGYPLACLSITILANRSYARADFNHGSACGRFTGYSTAIFHRAMGAWRRALDAVSYTCPVATIPVAVQTKLGVCLRPGTR